MLIPVASSGQNGSVLFDPLTSIEWYHAVWAEDPNGIARSNDDAVARIHNAGTARKDAGETHLDGANGMYVPYKLTHAGRLPHDAAYNVTDVDIRVLLKLDDWTPASVARGIVEKRISNDVTTDLAWEVAIRTDGTLQFVYVDSVGPTVTSMVSTAAVGATDGTAKWLRFVFDANNGASGRDAKFYTSDDGSSWTQLGSTVTVAGVGSITTNTSPFSFGVAGVSKDAFGIGGYFQRAILLDGIDGTEILDIDFTGQTADVASFEEEYGATVYVESNADLYQATGNKQPIYKSAVAALNDRPAWLGDGSNDYIGTSTLSSSVAQAYSMVIVLTGMASGKAPFHARSANTGWSFYWNGADGRWWSFAGSVLATTATNTADSGSHLLTFVANGASSKMYEDGSLLVTGAAGSATSDAFGLFDIGAVNFPFGGHIAFAGLYAGDITADPEWAAFKSWAAGLYGLTVV
jgi:hypothetical protein